MDDEVKVDMIQIYFALDGYRWQRKDGGNHKITGASSEAYTTKGAAIDNVVETQAEPYIIEDMT